jgi:uncharacterized protein YyaL (SSP411 family)
MSNHLANETSPYLLQHADNPVDWFPWGPEALARARDQDRPIFLSIGYSACHWCHVMAHESFEDPATASLLNQKFISIKVDREERPDLDAVYMQAVVTMTGQGGWPMSVFLTPEGRPFLGGTYFPPESRHGLPAFREVLRAIAQAWEDDRRPLLETGQQLAQYLVSHSSSAASTHPASLAGDTLDRAAESLLQAYDWKNGGWGSAPKFPQAMTIDFLLRRYQRSNDQGALDMATHALRSMANGGIRDHLGGGFHRYATDDRWAIPHFEKMLYDNALLALSYLHGWQITRDPELRRVTETTLDFLLREMRQPEGGFASALDADSGGIEGGSYLWTDAEIREALKDERSFDLFVTAYGVSNQGNFEGRNILHRVTSDTTLAEAFGLSREAVSASLESARQRLLARRSSRPRPALDDKVLTEWNGLVLIALAETARALDRPDYLTAAEALAGFALERLFSDGRLLRSWRRSPSRHLAYLADHAALGAGLLALYQTDFDLRWFQAAVHLANEILTHFSDPAGGFFDTRDDHERLVARPKTLEDSAAPSGNALAADLLLRLAALTGEDRYLQPAERSLRPMQEAMARAPTAFGAGLSALDFALPQSQLQLAICGDPGDIAFQSLVKVATDRFLPCLVIAAGNPAADGVPALLAGRGTMDGKPAAYLCRGFVCDLPATTPAELKGMLNGIPLWNATASKSVR